MENALIVGLGGMGVAVLEHLASLGRACWNGSPPWEAIGIDLASADSAEDHSLRLATVEARTILLNHGKWKAQVDWVPPSSGCRIFDDVGFASSGHFRWLGRLAFLRAENELIRPSLQAALARLEEKMTESGSCGPTRLMVVAALGGGTGSGMLADIERVLGLVSEGVPRFAFLILPQAATEERERSWGNTYGCLREIGCWREGRIPRREAGQGSGGGLPFERSNWKRVYLFAPQESEEAPFKGTLERIAAAMAAHFQRTLQLGMKGEVEHDIRMTTDDEGGTQGDGRRFSTCGAAVLNTFEEVALSWSHSEKRLENGSTSRPLALSASLDLDRAAEPGSGGQSGVKRIQEVVTEFEERFWADLQKRCRDMRARYAHEDTIGAGQCDEELRRIGTLLRIEGQGVPGKGWWWTEGGKDFLRRLFYRLVRRPAKDPGQYSLGVSAEAVERLFADAGFSAELQRAAQEYVDGKKEPRDTIVREICGWCSRLAAEFVTRGSGDPTEQRMDRARRMAAGNWINYSKQADKLFALNSARMSSGSEPERVGLRRVATKDIRGNIRNRVDTLVAILNEATFRAEFRKEVFLRCAKLVREELKCDGEVMTPPPVEPEERRMVDEGARSATKLNRLQVPRSAVRAAICRAFPSVFAAHSPLSERNVYALILFPREHCLKTEADSLRAFLHCTVQEVFQCHVRIIDHSGPELWIYYEDLFHAAADIRHLDRFREAYMRHPRREIFHLDYRLLSDPDFADLLDPPRRELTYCGNRGCQENIASLPRGILICPGCKALIRSRCGNPVCQEDDLHLHPEYRSKTCPRCHGVNRGAWWSCCQCKGAEILIPIDKERCPDCILRHHEEPSGFPLSCISRRPDLRDEVACPHCLVLRKKNPKHSVFTVRYDLLPFYRDGVNGVNRDRFFELAKRYKLPDGYRCPSCCTLLIPVDRRSGACKDTCANGSAIH